MILGERTLSTERGHDWRLHELDEFPQLCTGIGPKHALSHVNHWASCREEGPDGACDVMRIPRGLPSLHRGVRKRGVRHGAVGDIVGQFQNHGATAPRAKVGKGDPQQLRNPVRVINRHDPFTHAAEALGDFNAVATQSCGVGIGAPGDEEDGDEVFPSLGDSFKGVLYAAAPHHGAHANLGAIGDARVRVCHGDGAPLGLGEIRGNPELATGGS